MSKSRNENLLGTFFVVVISRVKVNLILPNEIQICTKCLVSYSTLQVRIPKPTQVTWKLKKQQLITLVQLVDRRSYLRIRILIRCQRNCWVDLRVSWLKEAQYSRNLISTVNRSYWTGLQPAWMMIMIIGGPCKY